MQQHQQHQQRVSTPSPKRARSLSELNDDLEPPNKQLRQGSTDSSLCSAQSAVQLLQTDTQQQDTEPDQQDPTNSTATPSPQDNNDVVLEVCAALYPAMHLVFMVDVSTEPILSGQNTASHNSRIFTFL